MLLYPGRHRHDYCHDFGLTQSHKQRGLLDPQHAGFHIHRHLSRNHHPPEHVPAPYNIARKKAEDQQKQTSVPGAKAVLGRFSTCNGFPTPTTSISSFWKDFKEVASDWIERVAGHFG